MPASVFITVFFIIWRVDDTRAVRKLLSELSHPIVDHGHVGEIPSLGDGRSRCRTTGPLPWAATRSCARPLRWRANAKPACVASGFAGDFVVAMMAPMSSGAAQGEAGRSIRIAAQMEEARRAQHIGLPCRGFRFRPALIAAERFEGISAAIAICDYAPSLTQRLTQSLTQI